MFFSYKGGSGRTVASANVAAALAKLGKRVLIIDMDVEAPGLHNVFGVEDTEKFKKNEGIQAYFDGDIDVKHLRDRIIIDLASKEEKGLKKPFNILDPGRLLYLMAVPRAIDLSKYYGLERKMKDLIETLGDQENLDYIILDAASGIREAFVLSIRSSDKLAILFRWSQQHLEGTKRTVRLLRQMKGLEETPYRPFKLIPSAVPSEKDLERIGDETAARGLRGARRANEKKLKEEFEEDGEIFVAIPEIVELKWREEIIVFKRADTSFETIARKIIAES